MNDLYVLPEVGLGLAVIALAWRYGFERLRRDKFRCELRRIRDELFDFMWKNNLDYNDAAYQDARRSLNAVIHMSGSLSPLSIVLAFFLSASDVRHGVKMTPPKRSLNPLVQGAIDAANKNATAQLVDFLFLQGCLGLIVRCLYLVFRALHAAQRLNEVAWVGANYVVYNATVLVAQKYPMATANVGRMTPVNASR